jgi:hypothetical protein
MLTTINKYKIAILFLLIKKCCTMYTFINNIVPNIRSIRLINGNKNMIFLYFVYKYVRPLLFIYPSFLSNKTIIYVQFYCNKNEKKYSIIVNETPLNLFSNLPILIKSMENDLMLINRKFFEFYNNNTKVDIDQTKLDEFLYFIRNNNLYSSHNCSSKDDNMFNCEIISDIKIIVSQCYPDKKINLIKLITIKPPNISESFYNLNEISYLDLYNSH